MNTRFSLQPVTPQGLRQATDGRVTTQVVSPTDRDELTALVMRLKHADERRRHTVAPRHPAPSAQALAWSEAWQLPREVHAYFELVGPPVSSDRKPRA